MYYLTIKAFKRPGVNFTVQRQETKYCDLCGAPIRGKGHTVVYEGGVVTVCDSCYARIAKYAKPYREEKVQVKQKVQQKSREEKELMVIDDYAMVIKNARERLKMTQKELADKLRVSENIIKRFESNKLKPTIEQAKALERILGVRLVVEVPAGSEQTSRVKLDELTLGDIVNIRERK